MTCLGVFWDGHQFGDGRSLAEGRGLACQVLWTRGVWSAQREMGQAGWGVSAPEKDRERHLGAAVAGEAELSASVSCACGGHWFHDFLVLRAVGWPRVLKSPRLA